MSTRDVAASLAEVCERLGVPCPDANQPATIPLARAMAVLLARVELLEKQMAAVQEGCSYIELASPEGEDDVRIKNDR